MRKTAGKKLVRGGNAFSCRARGGQVTQQSTLAFQPRRRTVPARL
jgi:hypothetical protein